MITVKVTGLEQVMKKFERMPREFIEEMDKAVKKSAYLIEGESKKVTPVDTGRLRASISSAFSVLQAIISPHTNYAVYVHEGTRFMQGRPYMKWGVEKAKDAIKKQFQNAVDILINK